jgi:hypothetical protein
LNIRTAVVFADHQALGVALKKKLIHAIPERNAQTESFEAFSSKQVDHVEGWLKMIGDWEDRTSNKNPYVVPMKGQCMSFLCTMQLLTLHYI